MKVLFIGDINGSIARKAVAKILPPLKKSEKIDFVIANADNAAHGSGVTEESLNELMLSGVDFFTNGDHSFTKNQKLDIFDKFPIIRPANYAPKAPGKGFNLISVGKNNILVINLIGQVFMKLDHENPFNKIDEILAEKSLKSKKISAIIVDVHAEATSEKVCFKHYLDGRVSAVLGTHTHVATADEEITAKGTAYITDVGMVGYADGSLGIDFEAPIKTFLTQIKYSHVIPNSGRAVFNAVLLDIDTKAGKTKTIRPITKFVEIK